MHEDSDLRFVGIKGITIIYNNEKLINLNNLVFLKICINTFFFENMY